MMRALLIRGMLAGAIAGVLAFGVAYVYGEPELEYAIGLEEFLGGAAHTEPHAAGDVHALDEETVSRGVQATAGLLTALVVYGAGLGGLFAIVFALAYGRIGQLRAAATSALISVSGFVAVAFVPFLKYPANPPAVGQPETLGSRTALFLVMIAISILAIVLAASLARRLAPRFGAWKAYLSAAASFIVVIAIACRLLPDVSEVPAQFSPDALWRFRMASLGMQFLLWAALGLIFGVLAERALGRSDLR
jgi:predicted cobalt transporter CbtA